jgi:AbrB family looped-hinge helix DNA binding protein
MSTVTVSEKGQVVIPAEIRKRLGITPGCQLEFTLEGAGIHVELKRQVRMSTVDEGFGMLQCTEPGERRLNDFDVAEAMRDEDDGRD